MKKQNRTEKAKSKKETAPTTSNEDIPDSDDERSFSNWFRTADGIEFLKLFVILNSIVVFTTLAWPNVKESLNELYYIQHFKKYLNGQVENVKKDSPIEEPNVCTKGSKQLTSDRFLLSMKDTCTILEYNNEV
ncbi:hypothetical protein RN001_004580 [Aquatica leii]|uniref:Uncharacterized protein n=1 Tax=Aquatica leii TaxID=1421715 RepID=A0AAN7PEQ2_9COLE|nr:hypothetical protein RN001_004580 [Aquatica leii]